MTENDNIKATSENTCNKIKAIYPHITVSGDVDNPYYNIDWYDIEKQKMYRGYSSYKLPLVRKWLQEEFEVVEEDIDDLINRKNAEIERLESDTIPKLQASLERANKYGLQADEANKIFKAEIKRLQGLANHHRNLINELNKGIAEAKAEAVKEFADKFLKKVHDNHCLLSDQINSKDYGMFTIGIEQAVNETKKEMAGEG